MEVWDWAFWCHFWICLFFRGNEGSRVVSKMNVVRLMIFMVKKLSLLFWIIIYRELFFPNLCFLVLAAFKSYDVLAQDGHSLTLLKVLNIRLLYLTCSLMTSFFGTYYIFSTILRPHFLIIRSLSHIITIFGSWHIIPLILGKLLSSVSSWCSQPRLLHILVRRRSIGRLLRRSRSKWHDSIIDKDIINMMHTQIDMVMMMVMKLIRAPLHLPLASRTLLAWCLTLITLSISLILDGACCVLPLRCAWSAVSFGSLLGFISDHVVILLLILLLIGLFVDSSLFRHLWSAVRGSLWNCSTLDWGFSWGHRCGL